MKTIKWFSSLVLVVWMGSGCASVHYLGNSSEPTHSVEVFYDENHIQTQYEVLGKAAGSSENLQRAKSKLIERAKQEGADAILITEIERAPDSLLKQVQANFIKYKKS